jgi:uroporphyrinogen decarboxylase
MAEQMTPRERFRAAAHFEPTDRPFFWPQWVFPSTVERWQTEGMPGDASFNRYFDFDRIETVPIKYGLLPPFKETVIDEDRQTKTIVDDSGARKRIWKDLDIGMPHWIEYGLKGRDDWKKFKARLNPDSQARYPDYWDDLVRCTKGRDYPLGIHGGSFYGRLRNWIGMENLALMYYDDPGLVHEMTDAVGDFIVRLTERALDSIRFDLALFWEDMAMKTASLISPEFFRKFMLPNYQKVTKLFRQAGIDVLMVDCDGNTDELVPLWLEGGISGIFPIEIAAGCDPVKYRETYGRRLLLMGGIDKRALRLGKKEVEREVMSKAPKLLSAGGWLPFVDHAVPPDVPLENFRHYLDLVRRCAAGSAGRRRTKKDRT